MKKAPQFHPPETLNTWLSAAILVLHMLLLFALPRLLPFSWWWMTACLPPVLLSSLHWGLIHEAIHKILHTDSRRNEQLGRWLGIAMAAPLHVLRFGHLMHHKLNRDWHGEQVAAPRWFDRFYYYANLTLGLYLSEILTGLLLAVLPRRIFLALARRSLLHDYPLVAAAGERFFYQRRHIRPVRQDMLAIFLLYGGAFLCYGAYWPVLAGFLLARGFVISFLDNIYHYATPADNSKAGKELALPNIWSLLLLRSNFHETHHLNPAVPWPALPHMHRAQARRFDGPWLRHAFAQWHGPAAI